MNPISPIITPFRWYEKFYQQARYQTDCTDDKFKLITDRQHVLPFQFKRSPSPYVLDKWLLRASCVEAQNRLLTPNDSLFTTENGWTNNGGFSFDCGNACIGTSESLDELSYIGLLTIGKSYTLTFMVNKFDVTTSGAYYKFYNGTNFIQNINAAGLYVITFTATSSDITFQLNLASLIGTDSICFTEVQITQEFQQEAEDIELDVTKLGLTNAGSYDYVIYCGQYLPKTLPLGEYYCIVTDLEGKAYFSEVFEIRDFFHEKPPYYILEWKNTCSIGDVLFDYPGCTYSNQLYLDEAVISRPDYPYKEEGEENGEQTFIPTFQKWEKVLRFLVGKCPEYVIDALTAITLHDTVGLTSPIRKKQEISDGSISVKALEADVQYIQDNCFGNVEVHLLISDRYVDSSCCIATPFNECQECGYTASYYNELLDGGYITAGGVIYAIVNDPSVAAVGLYLFNTRENAWNLVTLAEDATACFSGDSYIWNAGQWHLLPTIGSVNYIGDSFFVTGWAWPNSYVQVEISSDGITWFPQTPIENWAVFNLVGIKLTMEFRELYFRVRNFTLNCEYGYSGVYNWDASDLPKLKSWYKSDAGIVSIANVVSKWIDQSENGNDIYQSLDDKQPLLVAARLNGYPGILFDGVNDFLQCLYTQAEPVSVFIVFKNMVDPNGSVFDGGTADRCRLSQATGGSTTLKNNAVVSDAVHFHTGAYGIMSTIFYGGASYIKSPSNEVISTTTGALAMGGLTLGSNGDGASAFSNVSIVEVIVVDNACSSDERVAVTKYFKAKYLI